MKKPLLILAVVSRPRHKILSLTVSFLFPPGVAPSGKTDKAPAHAAERLGNSSCQRRFLWVGLGSRLETYGCDARPQDCSRVRPAKVALSSHLKATKRACYARASTPIHRASPLLRPCPSTVPQEPLLSPAEAEETKNIYLVDSSTRSRDSRRLKPS